MRKELHFTSMKTFLEEVKFTFNHSASQYVDGWEGIRNMLGVDYITARIAVINNENKIKIVYHGNSIEYRINMIDTPDGWYICATRHGKRGCEEMHRPTKKLWEVVHKVLGY